MAVYACRLGTVREQCGNYLLELSLDHYHLRPQAGDFNCSSFTRPSPSLPPPSLPPPRTNQEEMLQSIHEKRTKFEDTTKSTEILATVCVCVRVCVHVCMHVCAWVCVCVSIQAAMQELDDIPMHKLIFLHSLTD